MFQVIKRFVKIIFLRKIHSGFFRHCDQRTRSTSFCLFLKVCQDLEKHLLAPHENREISPHRIRTEYSSVSFIGRLSLALRPRDPPHLNYEYLWLSRGLLSLPRRAIIHTNISTAPDGGGPWRGVCLFMMNVSLCV